MKDTVIRRYTEKEGLQAIADLEKRGFEVVYPLTEMTKEGKSFTRDSYNRRVFQENIYSSVWIAKLRREKQ